MENTESPVFPGLTHICKKCRLDSGYSLAEELQFEMDLENGEASDEGHFSWHPCELCNCNLGGDRFAAHQWDGDTLIHLDICSDCLYLTANGSYPDDYIPCN